MVSRPFAYIAELQGSAPWGAVLDAGTGVNSASWLSSLETRALTLVTAAAGHARQVQEQVSVRPQDRLIVGDWREPLLLAGERFNTVLADYLVGAIDGFAPFFQEALFDRLAGLVTSRLYLVGLEPYVTSEPPTEAGRLVWEIGRYRDACLLLAGERPYREYPAQWVLKQLERVGLRIVAARRFPIRYKAGFVNSQIDMAKMRLTHVAPELRTALTMRGEALRRQALAHIAERESIAHGFDYVIAAQQD